jgi:type I restriction enzyme, S subunit
MIELTIPKEWRTLKVCDVGVLIKGINYKKHEARNAPELGLKPILRANNINGNLNFEDLVYVPEKRIVSQQYIERHDILFCMSSGSKHLVGKSSQAEKSFDGSYGAFCALFRPLPAIIPRFVGYFFQIPRYRKFISAISKGTNINNLKREHILDIDFCLPPSQEQNQIVDTLEELLSDLDNAIDNLKKAKDQLKVYRQAVLKYAFEGRLTEEWRKNNPYEFGYSKYFYKKIDEINSAKRKGDLPRRLPPINLDALYNLPNGWHWIEAHKVCQSVRDGTHDTPKYVEKGIPLITSKNLKYGEIDFNDVDFISESDHKKIEDRSGVKNGDILFGMIGTLGNPVVVVKRKSFSIKNVGLFKQNNDLLLSKYLKWWLDSIVMFDILKKKDLIRGTTQKFIALGGLRVLPVPVPCPKEQQAVIQEIESRFSVCDKMEETINSSLELSEALRQSILKQAFEGKLTEDWRKNHPELISGQNSANALLERIRKDREAFEDTKKRKK